MGRLVKNYFLFTIIFFFCLQANAGTLSSVGQIELVSALNLSEERQLNFGKVEVPSGQFTTIHVNTDGTIGENNTAEIIDNTNIASGKIRIAGSGTSSISISASPSSTPTGISFKNLIGEYDDVQDADLFSGVSDLSPPSSTGTELLLGAEMDIDNTVEEGNYSISFDLVINYQ